MSCCGSPRSSMRTQVSSGVSGATRHWAATDTVLEYTGNGQLTVIGPLTGTTYRFAGPHSQMQVRGADVPSLVSVPGLRAVR